MKINAGKLKEWVDVYKYEFDNSVGHGEYVGIHFFESKARFDEVWVRDYQTAIANNTISELKVFMRYDDRLNTDMRILRERDGKEYKVKSILFDETNQKYMNVMVELVEESEKVIDSEGDK